MNDQTPISMPDPVVAKALELNGRRSWARRHVWTLSVLAVLAAVAVVLGYFYFKPTQTVYLTEPAARRLLQVHVSATGTLKPLKQVDVGVEVSGTLVEVLADYNDRVKAGDVLARIDTERLEAQRSQSAANLDQARAQLADAKAAAVQARAAHTRSVALNAKGFVSDQGLETTKAARDRAEAAIASAAARVELAKAALQSDETALSKAIIRAPIDGIVLSRTIEPGQTVAATFQTPVLFTLAEDLSKMELHTDIDEADIGSIKAGQQATFVVDAYPGRAFDAAIVSVRNAPQTVQGVVTYEAILSVENADLSLKPGMTATAEILIAQVEDALVVPSAALRFAPDDEEPIPPALLGDGSGWAKAQIFVLPPAGVPERREVVAGLADSRGTAIVSGTLEPGEAVIYDVERPTAAASAL